MVWALLADFADIQRCWPGPAGLASYQADGWIELLEDDRCRLNYRGEFTAWPDRDQEAEAFLCGAYALMFSGLNQT